MRHTNLPFSRSYWVLPGRLLAGCYPGGSHVLEAEEKARALSATGVTLALNLMEEKEKNHRDGTDLIDYTGLMSHLAAAENRQFRCLRFPILDGCTGSMEQMKNILDAVDCELALNGKVYVHCWGGRGRAGTVVCCWLIRHRIASASQAVNYLQSLISHNIKELSPTPETVGQRQFVHDWREPSI